MSPDVVSWGAYSSGLHGGAMTSNSKSSRPDDEGYGHSVNQARSVSYEPLVAALAGRFNSLLADLPALVRKRVETAVHLSYWDELSATQRQVAVEQYDAQHDSARQDEQRFAFELFNQVDRLKADPGGGLVAHYLAELLQQLVNHPAQPLHGFVRLGEHDFPIDDHLLDAVRALPGSVQSLTDLLRPQRGTMPASDAQRNESTSERCRRVLADFRKESAKKEWGALARVAARDGRKRQTVKADIDRALMEEAKQSGPLSTIARTVTR